MALTFIKYSESVNYKSIRIHTVDNENSIRLLNWCRDKELYLYWWAYDGNIDVDTMISIISDGNYIHDHITICYLDESHSDVVELKLTWL